MAGPLADVSLAVAGGADAVGDPAIIAEPDAIAKAKGAWRDDSDADHLGRFCQE